MANFDHHAFVRRILEGMLLGTVYRNAGEMPYFEGPISQMMETIGFDNLDDDDRIRVAEIALATFDNRDYPGRGMMPGLEQPIQTMLIALAGAIQRSFARAH